MVKHGPATSVPRSSHATYTGFIQPGLLLVRERDKELTLEIQNSPLNLEFICRDIPPLKGGLHRSAVYIQLLQLVFVLGVLAVQRRYIVVDCELRQNATYDIWCHSNITSRANNVRTSVPQPLFKLACARSQLRIRCPRSSLSCSLFCYSCLVSSDILSQPIMECLPSSISCRPFQGVLLILLDIRQVNLFTGYSSAQLFQLIEGSHYLGRGGILALSLARLS